jgi:transketolase
MAKTKRSVSMAESEMDMRDSFAHALVELGEQDERLLFLDADLHTSTKGTAFKKRFPDRFYQLGIAEQNLFGVAAGLALEGFTPMPTTFASFVVRRALDQLAISICYPGLNVKIPGSYVGIPTSRAGASHNCIEDLAALRPLPNLRIADPGSGEELEAIMKEALRTDGPVYFRVTRYYLPPLGCGTESFAWGKGQVLRKGSDISIFGTGMMTSFCLEAAKILAKSGISAEVVHLASIKPIDEEAIVESVSKTNCAITAENASVVGGFGDAVGEVLNANFPVYCLRVGVRDQYVQSGRIEELLSHHRMAPKDIVEISQKALMMKETGKARPASVSKRGL